MGNTKKVKEEATYIERPVKVDIRYKTSPCCLSKR